MEKSIEKNISRIREEIASVCASCGRSEEEITLVAVSKKQPLAQIYAAQERDITLFGENRVQELLAKYQESGNRIRWHFIGHLQTNKVKQVLPVAELIHSVDSLHLAEAIAEQAEKQGQTAEILLQVNTSGEERKYGFTPDALLEACHTISNLSGLEVKGLMTMAPYTSDVSVLTGCFSLLRQLSEQIEGYALQHFHMVYLSMGMSNDYQIALKEGSNMLRIGSAIFGARN
jgi:pyridoxal phosphate enzyme (YggS family)